MLLDFLYTMMKQTYLEFSSSIILFIRLLALSDFSALAQAGCRADDLISSSYNRKKTNKIYRWINNLHVHVHI